MYLHIVMMTFNKELTPPLKDQLEIRFKRIPAQCDGIERFDFVDNMSRSSKGYTHALVSVFSSQKACDDYRVSAAHENLMIDLQPHIKEILVLDSVLSVASLA